MASSEEFEASLQRLERRYNSARLALTAARADFAALSSYAHAPRDQVNAARNRLQKALDRLAELSHRLDDMELQESA